MIAGFVWLIWTHRVREEEPKSPSEDWNSLHPVNNARAETASLNVRKVVNVI